MDTLVNDNATLPSIDHHSDLKKKLRAEVLKTYRTKMTSYLGSLAQNSPAIAKQFVPSIDELIPHGMKDPFEEGKDNSGIYGLERIYEDRALITPYFECKAYCRYCFKKTRTLAGDAKRMSDANLKDAMTYLKNDQRINTLLITGGDPFIDMSLLKDVLQQAVTIPHINKIRIGTRNILFDPFQITDDVADLIASFHKIDPENLAESKNISIALSINHADELTPEVSRAILKFISRGIAVRGQTVLLKGINDTVEDLKALLERFLTLGVVPYYLYHCYPAEGTKHYRTSVQKGLDLIEQLFEFSGALSFQNYVYASQIGKHRLHPGQTLTYTDIEGQRYIRATTPYKVERFLEFSSRKSLPPLHEVNEDQYIVSHYLDGSDQ